MKECMDAMAKRMEEYLARLERLRLADYLRYVEDRRRYWAMQFLGGVLRGLGTAVGFTILGAGLVWLLQGLAQRNLPVIGDFLAQIVTIVQGRLE